MKDMTFQIEKAKVIRTKISEKDNTMKPREAMLGLCDVILEVLAEMQDRQPSFAEHMEKYSGRKAADSPVERRKDIIQMLSVCANELENKVLFPSLDQTEIVLPISSGADKVIERNASFLIHRIVQKIED